MGSGPFWIPYQCSSIFGRGNNEKIEIAEVLNQIVKKACDFEKPKSKLSTSTTTTTATTTTAYRKGKVEVTAKEEAEAAATKKVAAIEKDVLVQPVVAVEAAYPNLVSIFTCT